MQNQPEAYTIFRMTNMTHPENIEVYVAGKDTAPLLAFLETSLGSLSFELTIVEGHNQYRCGNIQIFINKNIDGAYMSVYIINATRWSSDIELARDMAEKLHVTVRCDPGKAYPQVSPHSSTFVEINSEGEHLIDWTVD